MTRSCGIACGSTFCWTAWYHSVDLKLLEAFWCPPVCLHNVSNGFKMLDTVSWNRLWLYILLESLVSFSWFEIVGGFLMSTSSSPQCLEQVSNEKSNDVSEVRIHGVPVLRLYNLSCKPQIKHSMASLWYVFTTSPCFIVVTPC